MSIMQKIMPLDRGAACRECLSILEPYPTTRRARGTNGLVVAFECTIRQEGDAYDEPREL